MRDPEAILAITEQELQIRAQSSYFVGRASCFEELEASLKREAGELFSNGRGERAEHLREIAANMRLGAKDARERQKVLDEHVTALEAERVAQCKP